MNRFSTALALAGSAMLTGCAMNVPVGRPFVQMPGTDWQVVAVNGRATPATGDYMLRFGHDRSFGARFGCNHMTGNYRSVVGTVTVTGLASTRMGCPEPSATFERQAAAIFGSQMQTHLSNDGRLALSNAAGSITAVRAR